MDLFSIFKGGKYFDKHMAPKCDYCQFGRRAKDGNKVLCEKRGLVDCNDSCNKFVYSPLKRIPVKQLNFVGSLADEDIYIESAGDRAEKEELETPKKKEEPKKNTPEKAAEAPKPAEVPNPVEESKPVEEPKPAAIPNSVEASELAENVPVNNAEKTEEIPVTPENAEIPAEEKAAPVSVVEQNGAVAEMNALAAAAALAAELENSQ